MPGPAGGAIAAPRSIRTRVLRRTTADADIALASREGVFVWVSVGGWASATLRAGRLGRCGRCARNARTANATARTGVAPVSSRHVDGVLDLPAASRPESRRACGIGVPLDGRSASEDATRPPHLRVSCRRDRPSPYRPLSRGSRRRASIRRSRQVGTTPGWRDRHTVRSADRRAGLVIRRVATRARPERKKAGPCAIQGPAFHPSGSVSTRPRRSMRPHYRCGPAQLTRLRAFPQRLSASAR